MSALIGDLMAVADEGYGGERKKERRKRAKGERAKAGRDGDNGRNLRENASGGVGAAGKYIGPSARTGRGPQDDSSLAGRESGGEVGDSRFVTRPLAAFGMTSEKKKFPPKQMGELWELDFLRKALGMGMIVSKPWGDSYRYDFVVDTGGMLWRVQVRATETRLGARGYAVHASVVVGRKIVGLTEKDIDVIVGYIAHRDIWYVVPVEAFVPRKNLWFYPDGSKKGGMFEKFRDAWWLMTGEK